MNRNRKCVIVSALSHAGLLAVFFAGSAFVGLHRATPEQVVTLPVIHQIPATLVDDAIYNPGGAPQAAPAPAPTPKPQVTPPPKTEKTPPKVEKQPEKKKTEAVKTETPVKASDTPIKNTTRKVDLSKLTISDKVAKQRAADAAEAAAEKQRAADAAEAAEATKRAKEWNDTLSGIKDSVDVNSGSVSLGGSSASKTTVTGASPGDGDGTGVGLAVANYDQAVRSMYNDAWQRMKPSSLSDTKQVAIVEIIVNRSGQVVSAKIKQRSNVEEMNKSVQRVLDTVTKLPPFPTKSTDKTRSYTIRFTLKDVNF